MRIRFGNKRQARILVVDDDRSTAQTLSAILEEYGYDVATAFSGEEAVAKARQFAPDLLLTDVCMGATNGIEAATRITDKQPDCRVLFLSGHASMTDILIAAPERLVYSFTSKPLHLLDLLNAIAYMLSAVSTAGDSLVMAAEHGGLQQFALGETPAKAGFILRETRTGIAPLGAIQCKPDAVFFNMKVAGTAAHEMRPQ